MNLAEITNNLLDFFGQHEVFDLEKNFKDIVTISVDDDLSKALVLRGLDALCEMKFIEKVNFNEKSWHVLIKPLQFLQQQVVINFPTNLRIANIINIIQEDQEEKYFCNPLQIRESDINMLIDTIQNWADDSTHNNMGNGEPHGK